MHCSLLCVDGIAKAYNDVAPLLKICQGLATLEIVHSMLGFVKGGVAATFAQVITKFISLIMCCIVQIGIWARLYFIPYYLSS